MNRSFHVNLCCKPLPGEISVQNIPHGPVYPAGFAGYITLGLALHPLDSSIQSFRRASRELFNAYFRPQPAEFEQAWAWEERFSIVEAELFTQLVEAPCGLNLKRYGEPQDHVSVSLRPPANFAPIMVNRDVDSGYWDYPLREFTPEVKLRFVRFFDWDLVAVRDNQYVRVVIEQWPGHQDSIGKHALVEAQYVVYGEA